MISIATQTRPSMGRDPVRVMDFRSPSRGKRRGSYSTDTRDRSFGFYIDGADVVVTAGDFIAASGAVAAATETVTITGGTAGAPQYVYAAYNYAAGTGEIVDTPLDDKPECDHEHWRQPLAAFYLLGTVARLVKIHHDGDITIPMVSP